MARTSFIAAAILALSTSVLGDLQTCGPAQYDPAQYVCYENQFLCPITAGEPLSVCGGACYSKFQYTCTNGALALLPPVPQGTPFILTASNPTLSIDGQPINAGFGKWLIGGTTQSYCPVEQVGASCPPGNITAIYAGAGDGAAMDVIVPGGQQVYLDPFWSVAYTQAHSAYVPSGSIRTGLAAYAGGGFINLNGNGWGWVACPPRASGPAGPQWGLVGRNATNAENLTGCTPVNLKVNLLPVGAVGAWQYS
ncbi:carbohydrate binding-domain-containing protein [Bombardia bombarda]|uniref:Carbohydrate binding-domain-containing protein n=1 Tax=Bombardia bombarda TaxID=252184 RepID=A0AA40CG06_9PEZI|nr:carbohydrate binding-domain-containing protein [Bombardia bombarda]